MLLVLLKLNQKKQNNHTILKFIKIPNYTSSWGFFIWARP
jgi:hypothetical protein